MGDLWMLVSVKVIWIIMMEDEHFYPCFFGGIFIFHKALKKDFVMKQPVFYGACQPRVQR